MNNKFYRIIFPVFLTLTLFSIWAAFALIFINKYFHQQLPGYTIGKICIWEGVAAIFAIIVAKFMISRWGNIKHEKDEGAWKLSMNPNFGIYFIIYFTLLLLLAIWQFWVFSKGF